MSFDPADRDVPGDEWALDETRIVRLVGAEAARRGRDYASRGAVLSLAFTSDGPANGLLGRVQGSARAPYTVLVRREGLFSTGSCTCPMRTDCKHVAAVLFAARGNRHDTVPGEWERALSGVRVQAQPAAPMAVSALAIQFEVTERSAAPSTTRRVELRPVVRGPSGKWVRSGVSWQSLRYSQFGGDRFVASHHRLLEEILALNASTRSYPYNYSTQDRVFLDSFPSRRIWDMLAEAEELGIPLVETGSGDNVTLARDRATFELDIDAATTALMIRPVVTVEEGEVAAASCLLLGQPAHGVAWWTGSRQTAGRSVPAHLFLARLDRPVDPALVRLVEGSALTIPASDRPRFLREFYPGLRRRVTVTSRNASFEPPPVRLHLTAVVHHILDHRVRIRWCWTQSVGDVHTEVPLWGDDPGEQFDAALQARVLASIHARTSTSGGLYEDASAGPRLAETSILSGLDAIAFVGDILPALRAMDDVAVHESGVAASYRAATDAPVITLSGKASTSSDWFDLAVTITVDGEDVAFQELFVALAENRTHMVLPSGVYFSIERPELHQLRTLIAEARGLADQRAGSIRVNRFQASLWAELEALGIVSAQAAAWSASVRRLQNARTAEHPLPSMLRAQLRAYQETGFHWLSFLLENRLGGVLADDMGLGKTVQAIALIARAVELNAKASPFLVVAPTSVVGNWESECSRFAPDLRAVAVTETAARRGVTLKRLRSRAKVMITSYALFRIEFAAYADLKWSGLILDEAQAVKNHQSRGYQCARRLEAPFKLAITGTPMENNLMELWAMFSIATPGLFGDPRHFLQTYRIPIEREGSDEALHTLQRRTRPLLLRRTKEQVAADLPAKVEQVLELDLNAAHRRVYDTYLQRERQKVLGLIGDMQRNRFEIFRSLMLLRQASIDVSLVDAKHHAVPSTKLDAFLEQLDDVIAGGHRALVFSQFTRFLERVRTELGRRGIAHSYLDGSTRNRPAVLRGFKEGDAPVFLISLKAGGVGLNLAEADYCFLLDPWWNPATEAQAVDRAHRLGQTRQVMVYRLVARDTIEDKVMAMKTRKQMLFSSVIDGGGATSSALTAADVRALFE